MCVCVFVGKTPFCRQSKLVFGCAANATLPRCSSGRNGSNVCYFYLLFTQKTKSIHLLLCMLLSQPVGAPGSHFERRFWSHMRVDKTSHLAVTSNGSSSSSNTAEKGQQTAVNAFQCKSMQTLNCFPLSISFSLSFSVFFLAASPCNLSQVAAAAACCLCFIIKLS